MGKCWVNVYQVKSAPRTYVSTAHHTKEKAKARQKVVNKDLVLVTTQKVNW